VAGCADVRNRREILLRITSERQPLLGGCRPASPSLPNRIDVYVNVNR